MIAGTCSRLVPGQRLQKEAKEATAGVWLRWAKVEDWTFDTAVASDQTLQWFSGHFLFFIPLTVMFHALPFINVHGFVTFLRCHVRLSVLGSQCIIPCVRQACILPARGRHTHEQLGWPVGSRIFKTKDTYIVSRFGTRSHQVHLLFVSCHDLVKLQVRRSKESKATICAGSPTNACKKANSSAAPQLRPLQRSGMSGDDG